LSHERTGSDFERVAVFIIELILAKPVLLTSSSEGPHLLAPGDFIYQEGLIFCEGRRTLRRAKEAYERWWSLNQHKTLEALRDEWAAGRGPLYGSGLRWY
jgi:hypothetical protein